MRVAVYCRVSTEEQGENTSLATQDASCRAWAAAQGHTVVAVYHETASGTLWERPALQRLLTDAQRGCFDLVVCHALDRLSRDPEHLSALRVLLGLAGVALACVTEPLPSDEAGVLLTFVRGWAAKQEWQKIRERSVRGKRARLEQGVFLPGSTPLYGYRNVGRRRVIEEAEAAVVRQVFTWYAVEGCSLREVVRRLHQQGVPPPSTTRRQFRDGRQPRWGKTTVQRILREPAYKGETWAWRWQKRPGQVAEKPRDEWIRLPDDVTPAIVSRELWDAANARLRANRGEWTRNQRHAFLLRGLVFCAVCGRRCWTDVEPGRRIYRCGSRGTLEGPCGARRVPADALEAWVWEQVVAVLSDAELVAEELARWRAQGQVAALTARRDAIDQAVARLEQQQARLVRRFAQVEEGEEEEALWAVVRQQVAALEAERARLLAERQEVEAQLAARVAQEEKVAQLAAALGRVRGNLASLGWEERRRALEALGVRVWAAGRDPAAWRWTLGVF